MFRDALAATGEGAPQLLDIAQIAARSLPSNKPEPPAQSAAEPKAPASLPRLTRPAGAHCFYSGTINTPALSHNAVQTIEKAADACGLSLDIGNNYIEFAFEGRDSNQFVVGFLRTLAHAVGTANGEFRCEVKVGKEDSLYEFFMIRNGRLIRQRGLIVREPEEDITSGEPVQKP
jgi:hypothetical protein